MTDHPPKPSAASHELDQLRSRVAELERERLARLDAEQAVRESEARYRDLVSQCPDPIVVHRDGVLLFVNEAAVRMAGSGTRAEDLVGRHVLDFLHPEGRDLARQQLAEVSAGAVPLEMVENRIVTPDGREIYTESVERVVEYEGKRAVQVVVRDVTARVRAEAELQAIKDDLEHRVAQRTADLSRALQELSESEDRALALVAASPDTLVRIRGDGVLLDVKPGKDVVPSVDPAAMVGRSAKEFLPDEVFKDGLRILRRVLASGRTENWEYQDPTAESRRHLEARIAPSGSDEVLAAVRDVTERKRAEDAVARSEAKLRAMLDASPDVMVRLALDGQILDLHPGPLYEDLVDASPFIGRSVFELLPPDTVRPGRRLIARVCKRKEMQTIEYRSPTPLGPRQVEARIVASGDDEVLAVIRDITERRLAEDALRDSEERFRKIFEESPLGMALIGQDLRFDKVNLVLRRMLGYSEEQLQSRTFLSITHPDDLERDHEVLRKLESGEIATFTLEKRFLRSDGEVLPARVTGAQIRGERGQPRYGIAMIEDISEEIRAQRALREAEQRMRHSERLASIGTLAAGIAHEINNPIGSIMLAAQYARAAADPSRQDDITSQSLADIAAHARRCGRIVKSVLQFARQETLERAPCDLNECVQRIRDLALHVAGQRGATLEFQLDETPLPVLVNATAIEQALLNVIRNAVEAGGKGDCVRICTEAGPGVVRAVVHDAGRGMDVEDKTYLFDPFYTTRRAEGGTGLGLSISHGIVTDHGGTIRVDSQPGRGSTVTIELPSEVRPTPEGV